MKPGLSHLILSFIFSLLWLTPVQAMTETAVPAQVNSELAYALRFVGPGRENPAGLSVERLHGLLGFLEQAKAGKALYHPDNPKGLVSAYYETDVGRDMEHLLRLTYSPDVPEVFTAPSTLRRADWTRVDADGGKLPRLWERRENPEAPACFSGVEHLVNTPDQTTGAYYDYDLARTVILTRYQGRPLLLSLSKQTGVSGVGRKGLIVGPDERWDYLYTGETGLNHFGIGWAKTYMYDSYSVALYLESPTPQRRVRLGVFKWLSAGWSGINMVKAGHIHAGLARYGATFKQIVEHPKLTDLQGVERHLKAIQSLPEPRLKQIAADYLTQLGKQARQRGLLNAVEADALLGADQSGKGTQRGDLESIVVIEYLKKLLGRPHQVDLTPVLADSQ